MAFVVSLAQAQAEHTEYTFICALSPSVQKAAFHVKDADGNDLCLKIIAPNYEIDRLHREILALQSLAHPNVAGFREYVFSSKPGQHRHYLVEDFVEGEDLSDKFQIGKQWSLRDTSAFFAALCDGLTALKGKNLVHRDLKPSNIRVRHDGTPVIIDFGLARHLDLPDITNTSEGAAFGTPAYFAPEQFAGDKYDIDRRTDMFAVGIMIYQALVGRHPFWQTGMSRQQLCDAVCHSEAHLTAPKFVALPNPWQLIVGRLLKKERAERPPDAAHVATVLRKIGAP